MRGKRKRKEKKRKGRLGSWLLDWTVGKKREKEKGRLEKREKERDA